MSIVVFSRVTFLLSSVLIFLNSPNTLFASSSRVIPNEVYKEYLNLLFKEIEIINPKIIITFGNQVSSIILDKNISVSQCRKQKFVKSINNKEYSIR